MPYTYIIFSVKLNKYYVGACTDLDRRLYEHNIGHSKFTATGIPWKLKYTKVFDTLLEAKRYEMAIKKMKSKKYIERLVDKILRATVSVLFMFAPLYQMRLNAFSSLNNLLYQWLL